MVHSAPRDDSLVIIYLRPVKNLGMNPMGLSTPWYDTLDIISLKIVFKK